MALTRLGGANAITGVIPLANGGTGATSFIAGIEQADQWSTSTDHTFSSAFTEEVVTAGWSRLTNARYGQIGSALTESSGVFSFPTTGIYRVYAMVTWAGNNQASGSCFGSIQATTDNSSYSTAAASSGGMNSGSNRRDFQAAETILDVTDTSQVKFRMSVNTNNTSVTMDFMRFIVYRLGDT